MAQYIFTMRNVRKRHGDKVVLDDVSISFLPGAKIGVVGPNGAGKSSVLKLMAGLDQPNNGDAILAPGFTVGMLQQEPPLNDMKDVRGNVEEGAAETRDLLNRYEELGLKMAEPDADYEVLGNEMGEVQEAIDAVDGWELDSRLEQAMDALRLPPGDADVTALSGGERRRVALCQLLLHQPDLLLLDEPTNHLDAESVQWLEQHLAAYPGAVLAVTHDRYFLDNVAEWILELDRGRGYPYEGNYTTYLDTKATRLKIEGAKDVKRKKELERELEWVRSNPKARQAKSKARLSRYEELATEAERTRTVDNEGIQIPPGPRLGSTVIEADNLTKGFGDRVLIKTCRSPCPAAASSASSAPTASARRRCSRPITGLEQPDAGTVRIGETVKLSYVDQNRSRSRPGQETSGRPSPTASTTSRSAHARCRAGPMSRATASRAPTSRNRSGCSPAESATASTWP